MLCFDLVGNGDENFAELRVPIVWGVVRSRECIQPLKMAGWIPALSKYSSVLRSKAFYLNRSLSLENSLYLKLPSFPANQMILSDPES